jgi:hypothetical protein
MRQSHPRQSPHGGPARAGIRFCGLAVLYLAVFALSSPKALPSLPSGVAAIGTSSTTLLAVTRGLGLYDLSRTTILREWKSRQLAQRHAWYGTDTVVTTILLLSAPWGRPIKVASLPSSAASKQFLAFDAQAPPASR